MLNKPFTYVFYNSKIMSHIEFVCFVALRPTGLEIRGGKGYFSIDFWNSALKIKLKGKNTLCSLRFQS